LQPTWNNEKDLQDDYDEDDDYSEGRDDHQKDGFSKDYSQNIVTSTNNRVITLSQG
jgi:hypothetical protein